MVRDYFFYDALWFKDEMGNWGFGFGFTVTIAFYQHERIPYSPQESYHTTLNILHTWKNTTLAK
jgi:hypothetical protein